MSSQSTVTEKRTVITSSHGGHSANNSLMSMDGDDSDFYYKSSIHPRHSSVTHTPHSIGGSSMGGSVKRTVEISSGMLPSGFGNVSHTGVESVKHHREKEKRDMQNLNERFANYIEKVRFLEAQNKKLGMELDQLKSNWGKETSAIKKMYETELDEARRVIEETNKEKNKLEVKFQTMQDQLHSAQRELEEAKKWRSQDRETINKLNQQLSELEGEIRMLRRTNDSLDAERLRDKQTIARLQEELEKLRIDLSNETIARLDAENKYQTLLEEIEFLKSIHEQELKELSALAYRDTTAENREFWKNELSQAIRDIQQEYDIKVDQIRGEMETFYNLKVQEFRTGATKQNMEVTHAREEVKKLQKMLSDSRGRLADLEARNAQLEKQYQDLLRELEQKEHDHLLETNSLKEEMNKLRAEMEGMLVELQTLMDAKLSLELEIAAYRKLLEHEESRIPLRSSVRRYPSVTAPGNSRLSRGLTSNDPSSLTSITPSAPSPPGTHSSKQEVPNTSPQKKESEPSLSSIEKEKEKTISEDVQKPPEVKCTAQIDTPVETAVRSSSIPTHGEGDTNNSIGKRSDTVNVNELAKGVEETAEEENINREGDTIGVSAVQNEKVTGNERVVVEESVISIVTPQAETFAPNSFVSECPAVSDKDVRTKSPVDEPSRTSETELIGHSVTTKAEEVTPITEPLREAVCEQEVNNIQSVTVNTRPDATPESSNTKEACNDNVNDVPKAEDGGNGDILYESVPIKDNNTEKNEPQNSSQDALPHPLVGQPQGNETPVPQNTAPSEELSAVVVKEVLRGAEKALCVSNPNKIDESLEDSGVDHDSSCKIEETETTKVTGSFDDRSSDEKQPKANNDENTLENKHKSEPFEGNNTNFNKEKIVLGKEDVPDGNKNKTDQNGIDKSETLTLQTSSPEGVSVKASIEQSYDKKNEEATKFESKDPNEGERPMAQKEVENDTARPTIEEPLPEKDMDKIEVSPDDVHKQETKESPTEKLVQNEAEEKNEASERSKSYINTEESRDMLSATGPGQAINDASSSKILSDKNNENGSSLGENSTVDPKVSAVEIRAEVEKDVTSKSDENQRQGNEAETEDVSSLEVGLASQGIATRGVDDTDDDVINEVVDEDDVAHTFTIEVSGKPKTDRQLTDVDSTEVVEATSQSEKAYPTVENSFRQTHEVEAQNNEKDVTSSQTENDKTLEKSSKAPEKNLKSSEVDMVDLQKQNVDISSSQELLNKSNDGTGSDRDKVENQAIAKTIDSNITYIDKGEISTSNGDEKRASPESSQGTRILLEKDAGTYLKTTTITRTTIAADGSTVVEKQVIESPQTKVIEGELSASTLLDELEGKQGRYVVSSDLDSSPGRFEAVRTSTVAETVTGESASYLTTYQESHSVPGSQPSISETSCVRETDLVTQTNHNETTISSSSSFTSETGRSD